MNIPERFWNMSYGLVGILIAFLAIVTIKEIKAIGYVGANPNISNTISVDGTGDAVAIPDVATFSFTVTETAKTVVDAQTQATTKINSAIKAVKDGGVAEKDIQTQSYNINPHYDYQGGVCTAGYCPPSKSVLTGYDVSESVQVKVRDLSKAGALFSTIGSIGVQNVDGLTFSVDDPTAVQATARAKAIADAQSKANELAKELGVSLVRIMSFNENNNSPRPMMYAMGATDAVSSKVAVAPEIAVGQTKVTDDVTITYEIK